MNNLEKNIELENLYVRDIDTSLYNKIPIKDIKNLGASFAPLAAELTKLKATEQCLYRVNMRGNKGSLISLKDGSGLISAIHEKGKKGITGQAAFQKVNPLTINPEVIGVSITMAIVNNKLSIIEEKIDDIKKDMDIEKESCIKANQITLMDIFSNLKDCWDNQIQKQSFYNQIAHIKSQTNKDIIFYQNKLENIIEKNKNHIIDLHTEFDTKKYIDEITEYLKREKILIHIYSFSAYMECIVSENDKPEYLDRAIKKIEDYNMLYMNQYTMYYNYIEKFSNDSIERVALKGIANATRGIGKLSKNIPLLKDTSINKTLKKSGNAIDKTSSKYGNSLNNKIIKPDSMLTKTFIDNIKKIKMFQNNIAEMLCDGKNLYYK